MDISGEFHIPATRETVWEKLNDPAILMQCIPGCESLEPGEENQLTATMRAKIGPVKAKFTSVITLSELDPPNGYTISGEGKGGPAGFGKGEAQVSLVEGPAEEGGTVLRYQADLQVGGKLAQIGSRLVSGAARKIADDFFASFCEVVSAGQS